MTLPRIFTTMALVIAIFCQVAVGKCPDKERGTTRKYKGDCLEFIKDAYSHSQAKTMCEKHNGHLVTIENREKQLWLEKTLTDDLLWDNLIWIGHSRQYDSKNPRNSIWYLDDGKRDPQEEVSPLKFENWYATGGEPDSNKGRDCATMGHLTDYKWVGSICDTFPNENLVVCQYDGPAGPFANAEVYVPVIVVILGVLLGSIIVYRCYVKRKHLRRRLNSGKSLDQDMYIHTPEHHPTENTPNELDKELNNSSNNNLPHNYSSAADLEAACTFSYNINIPPPYLRYKSQHKDLDVNDDSSHVASCSDRQQHVYNRSVSAPPDCTSSSYVKASAPPPEDGVSVSISIVEEEEEERTDDSIVSETSPLQNSTLPNKF